MRMRNRARKCFSDTQEKVCREIDAKNLWRQKADSSKSQCIELYYKRVLVTRRKISNLLLENVSVSENKLWCER